MAVYNGHILAAGTYTPAWLNDSTGLWTYLSQETWCDGFSGSCGGTIYDLAVVGDTLFAASYDGILKLNLADSTVWTADTTD